MSSRAAAVELAQILMAGAPELRVVTDVRDVVPPCILVTPPIRTYDVACGYSASWQLYALAPGAGSAAVWDKLDELTDAVAAVLDVETVTPSSYMVDAGSPPLPAFMLTLSNYVTP